MVSFGNDALNEHLLCVSVTKRTCTQDTLHSEEGGEGGRRRGGRVLECVRVQVTLMIGRP